MVIFFIFIFLISLALLFWSGSFLIDALLRIAKFLGWREFVIAFITIALAATLPNLFVGISSVLHKIPQLSFADVVGGNVVDLTLAVAIAVFIAKGLPAESRLVQNSTIFTILIAIFPLLLIFDGILSRGDGIILILFFFAYIFWLFSKKERFIKKLEEREIGIIREFKIFLKDIGLVILGIVFLLVGAEGIVISISFFVKNFNISLPLIGILTVGLGNSLPEIYFSILAARKGQTWMILGDLMGSIIAPATLVLGSVALLRPIEILDFSPFAIARFFLIISALFFFFVVRTDKKITKREAIFLLSLYLIFVLVEILTK